VGRDGDLGGAEGVLLGMGSVSDLADDGVGVEGLGCTTEPEA
jgi:hypothetical protein